MTGGAGLQGHNPGDPKTVLDLITTKMYVWGGRDVTSVWMPPSPAGYLAQKMQAARRK